MLDGLKPIEAYEALIENGEIIPDPAQKAVMEKLQALAEELAWYRNAVGRRGWAARLGLAGRRRPVPKGLYMWGGVGHGKTMLMDLFYDHLDIERRCHVHFHSFMQEVHRRLHSFRQAQKAGQVPEGRDDVEALAKVITEKAWLLCFDEFHVTDIGDAMILGRLFEALFERGVVLVTTSNRHPQDLYKDGLQRDRFLPFIDMFMDKMEVFEFDFATDYRLERLRTMDIYVTPPGPEATQKLEEDFHTLTVGSEPHPRVIQVNGREFEIAKSAEGVGFSSFDDLCNKPLGPGDYLVVAKRFHTIILDGIPKMGPHNRNEAKRFVTLIDALYAAKVNFICSAEAPPTGLYTEGDGAFEFERTASRLIEMQSPEYMALPHGAKQ